jgi:hypothetical protein
MPTLVLLASLFLTCAVEETFNIVSSKSQFLNNPLKKNQRFNER